MSPVRGTTVVEGNGDTKKNEKKLCFLSVFSLFLSLSLKRVYL
jgi:hypothetical protein